MRGIALLFTLLITSLLFTISLGVYNLIIGEIALSGTGRESQLAFYAADAGTECALYWDIKHPGLSRSAFSTSTPAVITCGGELKTVGGSASSNFSLTFENASCVSVTVEKNLTQTTITAQGRNTCAQAGRRVERGLKVTY